MRPASNKPECPSQPTALTLIELLLSLIVASIVGAGIVSMLYFTSYASSAQANARDLLVASEFVGTRVNEAIQRSKLVLARGNDYLVLWSADTNDNGTADLSELRRIEYRQGDGSVIMYKAPADLTPDVTYSLASTDFDAATNAIKGTASFPGLLWGTASGWSTVLDDVDVRQANYVGWRITLTADRDSETAIGGAALRN